MKAAAVRDSASILTVPSHRLATSTAGPLCRMMLCDVTAAPGDS